MDKKRKKRKPLMLSAAMVVLLLPLTMNAQYDENKYGIQPWFGTSLMGKEHSRHYGETGNFTHQSFGTNYDGDFTHQSFGSNGDGIFTHQPFGNDAPTGSGTLILLAAGAGYAALKRKKHHSNHQNKSNQKGK